MVPFLGHPVVADIHVQLWLLCEELQDAGLPYGTSASGYSGYPTAAVRNRSTDHPQTDLAATTTSPV